MRKMLSGRLLRNFCWPIYISALLGFAVSPVEITAQSLADRYADQDLRGPEYQVMSQAAAWSNVEQGRDITAAWDIVNSENVSVFRCGERSTQPNIHFEATKRYCDDTRGSLDGVCFNMFSMTAGYESAPFLFVLDHSNSAVYFVGKYTVKGLYQFGVPRDVEERRGAYKAWLDGIFLQYEGQSDAPIPFKMYERGGACELHGDEQAVYCSSNVSQRVSRAQCHSYPLPNLQNDILSTGRRFIRSRAIAECQSSRIEDWTYQSSCSKEENWQKFVD